MRPAIAPLIVITLALGCGNRDKREEAPVPAPTVSATAVVAAPRGPFTIVLESKGEVALSAVEGGVVVADRTHWARAVASADLTDAPMPEGLPAGPGRVVRASGRLPHSVWLSFEKQRDDGKPGSHPLFRLQKDGWKMLADDWKPTIAAWSKNRILAASTSSGRLKIKVIEPSLARAPDDLPSVRLADPACEKSLVVADLAALRTGEVIAAGTCKPDVGAGAGASAKRYVIVRWPAASPRDAGAPPIDSASVDAGGGASQALDGGATSDSALDGGALDAGPVAASDEAPTGPQGVVDVVPGVSVELTHRGLYVRSAADVWAAAFEPSARPPTSRLFHFDGTTWGAEPLPAGVTNVRGLAGTPDGQLWLVTDRAIWKKPAAAPWEEVPPPTDGTWEMLDVRASGDGDIWVAARIAGPGTPTRHVILRTRPAATVVRWN